MAVKTGIIRDSYQFSSGEGVITQYDGFGRVSSSTLAMAGTSRAIGHVYDSDGNRIRITHPDSNFFTYDYDGLGRFVRVRESGADALVAFTYDNAGRRSGLASGGTATSYGYDPAGRLQGLTHNLAGTSADQVIGLGYNPASQVASRSGSNDSYAWAGAVSVSRDYARNGQNQYTGTVSNGTPSASFGYDANGNLTSDGTTTFAYDVENRLVSASGAKTAALVYDPLGRLFQTSGGPTGVTQFLYDDDALIGEYNSAGTMLHRYVHGTGKGVDDPLIWYDNPAGGWRRALVADQQGSIVAVADMYGTPLAINAYDEYGIPKLGNAGRFGYTGQAWIPELGMYYYKARIYSPTLGRFLQTDPIGYDDQINLYAYVDNDPVNRSDPTGKQSCPKNAGVNDCPDIPLPSREVRRNLERDVRESRGDGERGGQALQNDNTGEIRNRTGAEAGTGGSEEFAHYAAPAGEKTVLRSHTHLSNNNERGLEGRERRRGQNGPSKLDQRAMHGQRPGQGRPIQTIGPNVTSTMFRMNRQDYLVVDSGNRASLPDLSGQHIIVCPTDECP